MLVGGAGLDWSAVWTVTLGGPEETGRGEEEEEELESPGLCRIPVVGESRGIPPLSCRDLLLSAI